MSAHAPTPALRRRPSGPRGTSLIESMISMALLAVGMLGLVGAHVMASRADGQGLRVTQATALAQRTAHSLLLLRWGDQALSDLDACNNVDVDDKGGNFAKDSSTLTCKADFQLNPGGLVTTSSYAKSVAELAGFGLADDLDYNEDGSSDFQVFWNVANCVVDAKFTFACTGKTDVDANYKRIGVVVRWPRPEGGFYTVTTQAQRHNPNLQGE